MRFLSDEWIRALDAAARSHPALRAAARPDRPLVVEQRVTAPPPDEAPEHDRAEDGHGATADDEVVYHVVLGPEPAVQTGPAPAPTVRFTTDRATAGAVARGELSAQLAFIRGRLRLGGDVGALLEHQDVLEAFDDVFADVRARTEW